MDFDLSDGQKLLVKTARDFAKGHVPKNFVRQMEEDEVGFDAEMWKKMADLGWPGWMVPVEYGGVGGSFLDLVVLLEELGHSLVPSPLVSTALCCGIPILYFGTEEQKQQFLPAIAAGKLIMAPALTEPSATFKPEGIELKAGRGHDCYVLEGTKLFVSYANSAQWLLVAAREGGRDEKGITMLLVETNRPGISLKSLTTLASDRQFEVSFRRVEVPTASVLGQPGEGWEVARTIIQHGAVAQCAVMLGGAEQVLDMTVNYAKQRVQFDHPIGSFQEIQAKCANMLTDVDGSRCMTYQAAWKLSQRLPAHEEVSMAKAWVSDAYRRVCLDAHQVHGGIGLTMDYDLQLYTRRAKVAELAFGDAEFHRELVAKQIGL